MADSKRYVSNQPSDLEQILQEAQHRWLRPTEICEILRNYKKFQLTPDPPVKPSAGSLFLFDRKVLRYFRKDGHCWRKKKDGKTVKEAHEKLKAGSVDVLHCYYAHGEDNGNFQRRSYWMLDERLENIVLVHYREVKEKSNIVLVHNRELKEASTGRNQEFSLTSSPTLCEARVGYKLGVHHLKNVDSEPQPQSPQTDLSPCLEQTHSLETTTQTSLVYPNSVDWNGQTLSSEFEDGDSGEVPGFSSLVQLLQHTPHDPYFYADEITGFPGASFSGVTGSSMWSEDHGLSRNISPLPEQKFNFDQVNTADFLSHKLVDAKLDADNIAQDVASIGDWLAPDYRTGQLENYSGVPAKVGFKAKVETGAQLGGATEVEAVELKKLDSFGRWMNKEIGGDFDDSLMASDSGKYWNTLDTENEHKEVSSLSLHMQLDTDLLGPSLSQQQLFSINDFAPDWTNSGVETKVLIVGSFLGNKRHFDGYKWCCMFGEIEVSAEVLSENVIRCQTPSHAPGRVPFYITCSNRLACSEVREFEFRGSPSRVPYYTAVKSAPEDELRNLIRLVKLLSSGLEKKQLYCTIEECDKCKVKNAIYALKNENISNWGRVDEILMVSEGNPRDELIKDLLKDKLYEWLACQTHELDKGMNILDEEGQGVIHLAAALGFVWAVGPIVAAGVSPNFRDVRGKTALHWASYYGREETVIVLVRLGAAAGAVDDPTPAFPGGQKAADLASSRGHKGIAGYLAEADLTSHLSSLSVKGSVMDSAAVEILAEKDTENAAAYVDPSHMLSDEDLSLKGSLAALRRSAHAAALIQDAFRVQSFRHRQTTKSGDDISEASLDLVSLGCLSKVQQTNNFDGYLHSAAVKIQQKYRGWKGRKEFLKIRKRIVNIQAHVRGCQVRKQYKRVVWSVSIVEKAILRWRRKKPGLRGFRMKTAIESLGPDIEKNDEYDFLRIGRKQKFTGVDKALERVQSMVRHPEARDQYMRLVTKFEELKVREDGSCTSQQVNSSEESKVDKPRT